ncbi:MAG: hypothetical protein KDD69_06485 [Bdellovibrionales bacterium]|nr:hypothetical protein [Bdellovibrionales bacterium]
MTRKKRERRDRLKRWNPIKLEQVLHPGDVIRVHRDIFFTPTGRYSYEGQMGDLVMIRCGEISLAFGKQYLRFCSLDEGPITPQEIARTTALVKSKVAASCASADHFESHPSGFSSSARIPTAEELAELELDA